MTTARREGVNLSLFDVDDLDEMPKVRDMTVASASTREVTEFCHRYHYADGGGSMPWRYGLWHGPILLGVVAYNVPTRETCAILFGAEHGDKVWHMGRLALADTAPPNSESRLIGGSLRLIARQHPHVWAVITYAATDAGHIGYVYQATNALYTGTGGESVYYVDRRGNRRSNYQQGFRVPKSEMAARGWVEHPSGPKHRYVYVLGNKRERRDRMRQFRLPTLPYPKGEVAA